MCCRTEDNLRAYVKWRYFELYLRVSDCFLAQNRRRPRVWLPFRAMWRVKNEMNGRYSCKGLSWENSSNGVGTTKTKRDIVTQTVSNINLCASTHWEDCCVKLKRVTLNGSGHFIRTSKWQSREEQQVCEWTCCHSFWITRMSIKGDIVKGNGISNGSIGPARRQWTT